MGIKKQGKKGSRKLEREPKEGKECHSSRGEGAGKHCNHQ